MATSLYVSIFLLILGVVFDRVILLVTKIDRPSSTRTLIIVLINNVMIFFVLVAAYFVTGDIYHMVDGELLKGWLGWPTLLMAFASGFSPIFFASLWRVITGDDA